MHFLYPTTKKCMYLTIVEENKQLGIQYRSTKSLFHCILSCYTYKINPSNKWDYKSARKLWFWLCCFHLVYFISSSHLSGNLKEVINWAIGLLRIQGFHGKGRLGAKIISMLVTKSVVEFRCQLCKTSRTDKNV